MADGSVAYPPRTSVPYGVAEPDYCYF
jgi:hypothetical protein